MKVLIIQILRLGDALQLTPIVSTLKTLYPDADISIITSSLGKQIFERQGTIKNIYVLHNEEIKKLSKQSDQSSIDAAFDYLKNDLNPVMSTEWDWVINLSFSIPSALLAFLAHGKSTSGFYATENREYISKDKWFYYILSSFPNRKYSLFNWVDINSNIVQTQSVPRQINFPLKKEEDSWAQKTLSDFISKEEELIGFHPGASGPHKMWPIENFVSLAELLIARGKSIVIFGDKSEQELGKKIEDAVGKKILNLTGLTSLGQTAAIMSHCSMIICNDSGPMHLASAIGTPLLALFFSTHFIETGPYGENHLIIHPEIECFPCQATSSCTHKKCLDSIPVKAVLELIEKRHNVMIRPQPMSDDFPKNITVNRSRFSLGGFIEWVPVVKKLLTFDDLVRLILKLAFIPCLGDRSLDSNDRISYIRDVLSFFSWSEHESKLKNELTDLTPEIRALSSLLNELLDICREIFNDSCDLRANSSSITRLGTELQKKENSLSKHTSQYFDIILKFIEMTRNNIIEREFKLLAAHNVNMYKDALMLFDNIKDSIYLVSGVLNERELFHKPK